MLSNDLQNTISKLETAFGSLWFWTSDAYRLNFIVDELIELNEMGIIEKRIVEVIGIEWRLNPVMGCETPPLANTNDLIHKIAKAFGNNDFGELGCAKHGINFADLAPLAKSGILASRTDGYGFTIYRLNPVVGCEALSFNKHQLVKVKAENGYNYGYLKYVDDVLQIGTFHLLRSDDEVVSATWKANGGMYIQAVKYADLIDIEGNEWARCDHCKKPLPLDQLTDTVVSLCESCADVEDYDLIWEIIDLEADGQSIEHLKTINSGRAYEKYMSDMEYWQNKVERAKSQAYKYRLAHEDCLDAARERREVK